MKLYMKQAVAQALKVYFAYSAHKPFLYINQRGKMPFLKKKVHYNSLKT